MDETWKERMDRILAEIHRKTIEKFASEVDTDPVEAAHEILRRSQARVRCVGCELGIPDKEADYFCSATCRNSFGENNQWTLL